MKSVVCFGDSNTYGHNPVNGDRFPESVRWPCLLQNLLGSEFKVIEEGLNGRTTVFDDPNDDWKNGLDYIKGILCTHRPVDYLVIMLGTDLSGVNIAVDRIFKSYYRMSGSNAFSPSYSIEETDEHGIKLPEEADQVECEGEQKQ